MFYSIWIKNNKAVFSFDFENAKISNNEIYEIPLENDLGFRDNCKAEKISDRFVTHLSEKPKKTFCENANTKCLFKLQL